MPSVLRTALIPLIAALGLAGLSACGDKPESAAGEPVPAGVVNVYSARHYDSDRAMFDAFTRQTGIRVRVRQGDASQLLETLRQEGAASPADIVISADAGTLWLFQDAGLLQPLDDPRLSAVIPASLTETGHHWFGLSLRVRVIAVDPERVPDGAITRYSDLADPRWRGEICVRSSTNVYNLSLLGDLIDRWGQDQAGAWAAGVVANFARKPQGGDTDQIRAIAAGECAIALVNHYYWLRMANSQADADREAAAAVRLIFPDQDGEGSHRNITGAGIVASAPHREAAIALLEFLASPAGQEMLVRETGEFPIREGVSTMPGLEALSGYRLRENDLALLGANQALARQVFDRAGWN